MRTTRLFFTAVILLAASAIAGEPRLARTMDGRYVRLDDDGKWTYLTEAGLAEFMKASSAGELRSIVFPGAGLKYDSGRWTLTANSNKDAEFTLRDLPDGLYCMFIPEKGTFSLDLLKEAVMQNAKGAAESYEVLSEERKTIRGKEFLILKSAIQVKQTKFIFKYALYSAEGYSLQVIVYGLEETFKASEPLADKLLEAAVVP